MKVYVKKALLLSLPLMCCSMPSFAETVYRSSVISIVPASSGTPSQQDEKATKKITPEEQERIYDKWRKSKNLTRAPDAPSDTQVAAEALIKRARAAKELQSASVPQALDTTPTMSPVHAETVDSVVSLPVTVKPTVKSTETSTVKPTETSTVKSTETSTVKSKQE